MMNADALLSEYWHDLRTLGDDELMTWLFTEPDRSRRAAIEAEIDRRHPQTRVPEWMLRAIRKTVLAA